MVGSSLKKISAFKLTMLTLAFVMSIRNLPMLAETGWHQIFYMLLAGIVYLVPVGLISAELGTAWHEGIYVWIKKAFGERWAFVGVWMLWVQMFFGMVMIGSFIAAMLAFVFHPSLANNNLFIAGAIIVIYWVATLFNLRGLRSASIISSIGIIVGVFIPFALIIIMGIIYLLGGHHLQIEPLSWHALFPKFNNINHLTFFIGIIFVYAGLEVSSVHAGEVNNPQKDYPKVLFFGVALLMVLNIVGAFCIEMVVPAHSINLASGVMQTFTIFFTGHHLHWLIPIVAGMAFLGAFGQLSTWVLGPSKAMLSVAQNGDMPRWWQKTNKYGVPVRFVYTQAIAISVVALIYAVVPSINSAFFMVLILTTTLYATMYILLFAAGIRLRYKSPDTPRAYRVPGKNNSGMWILGVMGIITMLFVIVLSFFPPSNLKIASPLFYTLFQICGLTFFFVIPLIIFSRRKPEWKQTQTQTADDQQKTEGV
jgi:glutamate:GABA antiporter